jgi:hypothetical protein
MKLAFHARRKEYVDIQDTEEIHWKLEPRSYSYFGMTDALVVAHLITAGIAPAETGFLVFSIVDGVVFQHFHSIFDVGISVEAFAYRKIPGGSGWSAIDFGPAVRAGRLVLKANLMLLSFRGDNWAPGISVRATIPFASERELGSLAFVIPAPTVGLDVILTDSLGLDQTQLWLGLGWVGNVEFLDP